MESFRTLSGTWWVDCNECTKGMNGTQSCEKADFLKSILQKSWIGCTKGSLLQEKKKSLSAATE